VKLAAGRGHFLATGVFTRIIRTEEETAKKIKSRQHQTDAGGWSGLMLIRC